MAMVALDAARTRRVEIGSLEARWLVAEGDVSEYLADAAKHPLMQAKMAAEEKTRLAQEEAAVAAKAAEDEAPRRRR